MAKLFAEMCAREKTRRESVASNEAIHIDLYEGRKWRAAITLTGDGVDVNGFKVLLHRSEPYPKGEQQSASDNA